VRAVATGNGHGPGLTVAGELDLATAPQVNAALARALSSAAEIDSVEFALNLAGLTFCDVAGLDALTDVHDTVTGSGGTLNVIPPAASGPTRLLQLAVNEGWLAPAFRTDRVASS
jgi:anti-sigma B factor antagonist